MGNALPSLVARIALAALRAAVPIYGVTRLGWTAPTFLFFLWIDFVATGIGAAIAGQRGGITRRERPGDRPGWQQAVLLHALCQLPAILMAYFVLHDVPIARWPGYVAGLVAQPAQQLGAIATLVASILLAILSPLRAERALAQLDVAMRGVAYRFVALVIAFVALLVVGIPLDLGWIGEGRGFDQAFVWSIALLWFASEVAPGWFEQAIDRLLGRAPAQRAG
jgi:hypothetical protein